MKEIEIERAASAILACYQVQRPKGSFLVGISGIDGAGKGYVTREIGRRLEAGELRAVSINVDGWLNLPGVRFGGQKPAERFYANAIRLDEMFENLVLPLKREGSVRLLANFTEETASAYRPHVYDYRNVDVTLLEGIYLFKREYREHFHLRIWIDCSFETALARAVSRAQEGLPPEETIAAYRTIYFPAQEIHFERDDPRGSAHFVLSNDVAVGSTAARQRVTRRSRVSL